jgi:acetyltransferase-like isoleucine patch superfamily enzyme
MVVVEELAPWADQSNNRIEGRARGAGKLFFRSRNCRVIFHEGCSFVGNIWLDCDGGIVEIGRNAIFRGGVRTGLGARVVFGAQSTVTNAAYLSAVEGTTLIIGEDCMLSSRNQIRCDDAHPIFCRKTGKRLNPSADITIGPHVWLAYEALVSGGVVIGEGAIIGQRSLVTSDIPAYALAVGAPARVVREDVEWERSHLSLSPPFSFPDKAK